MRVVAETPEQKCKNAKKQSWGVMKVRAELLLHQRSQHQDKDTRVQVESERENSGGKRKMMKLLTENEMMHGKCEVGEITT